MKACAQLCHKFCIISDHSERKICENVWKIYWGTEIIFQSYKSFIKRVSTHFPATSIKTREILREVRIAIDKSNKDYDLVLTRLYLYYDMKLVTLGIDNQRNLIVQFPVFVQPYTQKRLIMYQIETVPVPILDENEQVHSYTELKIEKPYIALNEEMYITLSTQELKMCKKIGYEYYCEELFVVKSKTRYSCTSTIYFNLESDVIKANCEFQYYYNKTDIKPTVLDGGFQIILANWPNYRKIMCLHNNNIPINIPGHPYVLMNWSILCNCNIEAESNFLLESLAACEGQETKTDLEMHFHNKFSLCELLWWHDRRVRYTNFMKLDDPGTNFTTVTWDVWN